MESKELPTIEEFLNLYAFKNGYGDWAWLTCEMTSKVVTHTKNASHEYAVLFARHHVNEAKKEIGLKVWNDIENHKSDMLTYVNRRLLSDTSSSILNAYPLGNIK